jgi:UDP-glucose 4-epimerase
VADGLLTEADTPRPTDAYGRSKLAAERGLTEICAEEGMDHASLRPVLVYGPGVKGNMAALLGLARSRLPLPLGALSAKRSILAVENLCAAVETVTDATGRLNRAFIVADPEPLTVGEMAAIMRAGLGRAGMILPVPEALLRLGAKALGREEAISRLAGALSVSPAALVSLGWTPPVSTQAGLQALARHPASAPSDA